jgi:hypothetical protein
VHNTSLQLLFLVALQNEQGVQRGTFSGNKFEQLQLASRASIAGMLFIKIKGATKLIGILQVAPWFTYLNKKTNSTNVICAQ